MSVRIAQMPMIMSGLMTAGLLLTDVQAAPVGNNLKTQEQLHCGALSPLFLKLGDAYFDLADAFDPARAHKPMDRDDPLASLTSTDFSNGWGYRVNCTGSADRVQAQKHPISLEDIDTRRAGIADPENAILVTAYEYDATRRRLTRETVMIPASHFVQSSIRQRQATRTGSYLKETSIQTSVHEGTLTIEQSVYVNGTLAQWQTWHLTE